MQGRRYAMSSVPPMQKLQKSQDLHFPRGQWNACIKALTCVMRRKALNQQAVEGDLAYKSQHPDESDSEDSLPLSPRSSAMDVVVSAISATSAGTSLSLDSAASGNERLKVVPDDMSERVHLMSYP